MNALEKKLVLLLANGQFHSGEQLRLDLNVSRSRVHQMVESLRLMGLNIDAVKGRGYRIFNGLDLLNADAIKQSFPQLNVNIFETITSTNDHCLQQANASLDKPLLCLAEKQTKGRGRQARPWLSPFACNIYLSLLWRFDKPLTEISGLTLAVGVCVAELLSQMGVNGVALKWPNDVYVNGAKIAGILTEVVGDALGPSFVVIGIGLNIQMPPVVAQYIEQPWTDCHQVCPRKVSRTQWAIQLTRQLVHTLDTFAQHGLPAFLPHWQRYDYLQGRILDIAYAGQYITTQVKGITEQGYLRIADPPYQLASVDYIT